MLDQVINIARRGVRKLPNYLLLFFILVLLSSLFRNVLRINKARAKIQKTRERIEEIKRTNEELEAKLAFVKGEEFVEKQIRDKLGLAKEGEVIVILPDPELVKKLAPVRYEEEESLPDPNWKKWAKLFF